jgi:hypothetical protein
MAFKWLMGRFRRSGFRPNTPRAVVSLRCEWLEGRSLLAVAAAADLYRVGINSVLDTTNRHEIVPLAATWSYFAANTDPSVDDPDFETTWYRKDMQPASYNGPPFQTGSGLFALGVINFQNPPGTVLEMAHTAYFTRAFEFLGDPARVGGLVAEIVADDGAIFYLNGQRIGDVNMGPNDGVFNANALGPGNETALVEANLANRLVNGTNYLAVSVHNLNFGDTDLGFDMRLGYRWRGDSVLDNDSSNAPPPNNVLRVVAVQAQPVGASPVAVTTAHGTLTIRPDGTFRYAPAAGYVGSDSFTYRAADGTSTSSPTTVSLQVEPSTGPTCDAMDLNATGLIERGDIAALVSRYGGPGSATSGDFNGDGRVGMRDLVPLRDALGEICSGAAQAVVTRAHAVDRILSQQASATLRTSVRRLASRGGVSSVGEPVPSTPRSQLTASRVVTALGDIVSVHGLRGRRGAWA